MCKEPKDPYDKTCGPDEGVSRRLRGLVYGSANLDPDRAYEQWVIDHKEESDGGTRQDVASVQSE